MSRLLIFGPGYTAARVAAAVHGRGWEVVLVRRAAADDAIGFSDPSAIRVAIASATHILSSVPPEGEGDAVLAAYGSAIATAPARWIGYLSSTGVYGDAGGAWVDESAPYAGRRSARVEADRTWLALHREARVFRLPGIYGPGRSALERVRQGRAHRIDLPAQVFSRVHVDDIVAGVTASFEHGQPGAYNLADDFPGGQNAVIEYACRLLGLPPPPLRTVEEAGLSAPARAFYDENRRVANGKAKRLLGWAPAYRDYRAGLRALSTA